MRILVSALTLGAVAVAGVAADSAHASAGVHIKWMNCVLHPGQLDIVYIENTGDAAQDLTGWELRSDGENERMSLTPAGTIDPDQEIFATAGAHAVNLPNEDVFLWSNNEMLRDSGDPPDYVRLLDASGDQVSGMDCNHNPLAAPTAAPTALPADTPAPTPAPAPAVQAKPASTASGAGAGNTTTSGTATGTGPESIPVGGGPPGMDGGGAAGWLLAGAVLAAAGFAVTTLAARGHREPATAPSEGSSRHA